MVAFINTFISYLILMIIFFAIIVGAVLLGKKLRDKKDASDAVKAANAANVSSAANAGEMPAEDAQNA